MSGEPVPLVFTVTNDGGAPLTLWLPGRTPSADFRISARPGGYQVAANTAGGPS
jgi:hypothetical protein